jgi:hypothetical protein
MGINPYNSTNWYPEDLPKPDVRPSNKYATWIWLGLVALIVGALAVYVVVASAGRKIGCTLTDCRSNPVAAPLSWDEQFAIGQAAALKQSPEAVLDYAYAQPVASWPENWAVSNTLKLSLNYVTSSGDRIHVDYGDTTQDSNQRSSTVYKGLADDLAKQYYQSRASVPSEMTTIKISPREAEIATWAEAIAEAKNDGVDIAPIITLDFVLSKPDKHLSWDVTYWPVPVDSPPNRISPLLAIFGDNYSSQFTVDATTGEITKTDLGPKLQVTKR